MNCKHCGHSVMDHGPISGRWQNPVTKQWDVIIPGRLCFHEENVGHCEDLCDCPGYEAEILSPRHKRGSLPALLEEGYSI